MVNRPLASVHSGSNSRSWFLALCRFACDRNLRRLARYQPMNANQCLRRRRWNASLPLAQEPRASYPRPRARWRSHRAAGSKPVILVLDAHARHPEPFAPEDLVRFADATLPLEQLESEQRRRIMRLARSTKRRPALLTSLESRYITHSPATQRPVVSFPPRSSDSSPSASLLWPMRFRWLPSSCIRHPWKGSKRYSRRCRSQ